MFFKHNVPLCTGAGPLDNSQGVRVAPREVDAARLQERLHAVIARLPVDIDFVIVLDIERHELGTGVGGGFGHVLVEERFPGGCMDRGRARYHAIKVDDEGLEIEGEQIGQGVGHWGAPWLLATHVDDGRQGVGGSCRHEPAAIDVAAAIPLGR